jgi:hypothetical protein
LIVYVPSTDKKKRDKGRRRAKAKREPYCPDPNVACIRLYEDEFKFFCDYKTTITNRAGWEAGPAKRGKDLDQGARWSREALVEMSLAWEFVRKTLTLMAMYAIVGSGNRSGIDSMSVIV